MITSPHNPRIKLAARLRDHRQRRKEGKILIDGTQKSAGRLLRAWHCKSCSSAPNYFMDPTHNGCSNRCQTERPK